MAEQFDGLGILWNTVSKEYNIGTYDEFSSKMQDREKRKAFYNTVGKRYNLGKTFIEFENKIKKKEELPSGEMPEVGGTRLSLSGFKQNTLQGGLTDTIKESLKDNLLTKEDKSQFSPGILKEQSLSMPGSEMISSNIPGLFKKDPYAGLEYGLRKQSEERLARENRYRGTIAGNINWEDESTAKKIAGGFATGMASLPGNVINALDYMYKIANQASTKDALLRQGGKEYKDVFDEFKENDWWKQYRYGLQTASQEMMGGSIVDQWKSGDIKGAIESAVVGAAQSLPLTLAAMFGGPMGLTSVGLVAAGEKYDTLSETDLPMANKLLNATITGSLEAATESITQGYGKVLEGIFQREGKKIGKDIIKQGFKGWLYQPLKRLGIYTAPVGESLSEGINGWSEYLTDVAFGIEEYSSDNAKRAFLDNAAIGLPMGSTFSIVGASGKLIKPASKTRAENENIKKELKDKAKVPEDEKELYMDKVLKDVPKEYAEPVRKQIAELLIKKDELQQKQEEAGEKIKPVFDKQIKAVDNAISEVVNAAEGFAQDTETKGDQLKQVSDEKAEKKQGVPEKPEAAQQEQPEPVETEKGQEEETVKPKEFKVTRIAGLGMGQSQASGTYYSTEEGNRYETVSGKKAKRETVVVENPIEFDQNKNEFTNLRNEVLQKNIDKFEEVDFDGATIPERITVDDLSESGLNKLGEFITKDLRRNGHYYILFTGEGEGEFVVFPSTDEPGQEVTPQDIVDTILNYPSARARKTTDLQTQIARRYKEVTGESIRNKKYVSDSEVRNNLEKFVNDNNISWFTFEDLEQGIETNKNKLTKSEYEQYKDYINNEKESFDAGETFWEDDMAGTIGESQEEPVREEQTGTREKLDQEINDLKDQLVKAKQNRQEKIAEFNSRKGLFGDTKRETEGTTLFESPTDLSQESLNKFIQPEENVIKRLTSQIDKLESTKESKIKESEGQLKIQKNESIQKQKATPVSKVETPENIQEVETEIRAENKKEKEKIEQNEIRQEKTGEVSPTEVRDNDKQGSPEVNLREETREERLTRAKSKEELNSLLGKDFKFSDKDWQKAVGEAEKKGWFNKEDVDVGTSYGYASTNSNTKTIDDLAKDLTEGKRQDDFIISDRVRKILNDLGVPVAEKKLPSRYAGLYKLKPEKIRVQAAFDIVVATHEAAHYISDKAGLFDKIKGNKQITKDLTNIYVEFYPGAKRSHKLNKRVEEGIATLFENYFTNPNEIGQKYPRLVNEFINPKGKYHDPKFTQLINDMNSLVEDYAKLNPEQKIGGRIVRGKEIVDKDKGFNTVQRIKYEYFNRFEPLSRISKKAGVSEEFSDPYVHAFQWMNRGTFIHDWIKGNSKMIIGKDGNWISKPKTIHDYLKLVKNNEKEFEVYLVSRRVLSDYNSMISSNEALRLKQSEIEGVEIGTDEYNEINKDIINLQSKVDKLRSILKNDAFNIHDIATVVNTYKKQFFEAEKIFDDVTKSLIDFSENTGLISEDIANEYRNTEGYAPMFRFINDELIGDNFGTMPSTNSQTKAKMFKQRTGSKLDIVSPIYNQMIAVNEVISKGLENNIWRNVAKLADNNVEIARRFEKIESEPLVLDNGSISYPQDKDPSLIKVMINGQRNYYMAAPELLAVSKNLRGEEWNVFSKMIRLPSALFTRLTTSANPLFALGNLPVDQVSAYIQSKTGYIPGVSAVDSFVEMAKSLKNINSDEETLFRKYIRTGGRRQTFASFHNLSPEETIAKISGEKTFDRVLEKMDLGLSVLEFPSNSSEYMSRFAEYKRAINMGKTETEAMFMASQVTVPFQLYGNWHGGIGKTWIKSLPYFNAALQVNYKFLKSAKENPEKVAIMGSALLGTSLTMAALVFSSGSDEQKRLLANMPARELARAIFFPHPLDKKKLIRIRIPENLGVFTGLGYLFAIQHYTKQKARYKDYIDNTTAFIPDQFNPLKPTEMTFAWVPQVLSPSIETAANIRTYPELSPIVPEYMIESQPPELQYYEYTTNVAKKIGSLIGVSPAKTEYWIRNQFGAVGGMAIGKLPNNPLILQEEHHVMRGRSYSYFYDDKNKATQEYNSLKLNSYNEEEQNGIIEDYVLYNKTSDVLSNMRRTIQVNKDIPESIKQRSFELLVKINNGERKNIYEEIEGLNTEILDFLSDNGIDIGRTYKVTVSSIYKSIREYKKEQYKN